MIVSAEKKLEQAPKDLSSFGEIAVQYKPDGHERFNALKPEERVLLYYLFRASLPGHYILADQMHRHARDIFELFEFVLENKDTLQAKKGQFSFDVDQFINDVTTYLVYLWANHGQYFIKEQMDQKRTPERIGLKVLNKEHLETVLQQLAYDKPFDHLMSVVFDRSVEPTMTVPDDIQASAVHIYHPDFTNEDFASLPADKRAQINAYFDVEMHEGKRVPVIKLYKIGGIYSDELDVAAYWLQKARDHVNAHPHTFDAHMGQSLDYLIKFLQTGDEEWFKKHSKAWTKTNNNIDYNFGFIETYKDPKNYRGMFQSEVTVKTINMEKLNKILPVLEKQLPFPEEFKRKNLDDLAAIPNASINTILFATGDLGPIKHLAAYCLPNYEDIRAEHGSKQIIYHSEKGLGELVNPELYRTLFYLPEEVQWLKKFDPEGQLSQELWNIHVILHETLGHGSGRSATHTFKEGDKLTIGNKTYRIGDEIPVTNDNINEFLGGYTSSLEELRAEIIALYTSIFNFDELAAQGLFKDWPERIGKEKLIEELIKDMAKTGLRRLLSQSDDTTEIRGAHAQANTTIMNYLLDGGGLELVQQEVEVNGEKHTVLGFNIVDIGQLKQDIIDLAQLVQQIKSTGDGQKLNELMQTYVITERYPRHKKILKNNLKRVVGDLKVIASLYPHFEPVKKDGIIVDITARWPKDMVEQFQEFKRLTYSKES